MSKTSGFLMKFDKNTIDHLGIKLYSTFPPVIAELVSNSYDAEASFVQIAIDYENKQVSVKDDGHGMTHDEINESFLTIGRNRRTENNSGVSKNGIRKVTGKKGLGKLAVFGIAESITISSIESNRINELELNYSDLKESPGNEYKPKPIKENQKTEEKNGTEIIIKDIFQKNITPIENLALSLSKRFSFYDEDFEVIIYNKNNQDESMCVDKRLYFENINKEFTWSFPEDFLEEIKEYNHLKLLNDNDVKAEIFTKDTPLTNKDKGFILYARKKLASQNTFFNDRSNDHFNSYVTGYFNIDYIDEDNDLDLITTARQAILWEKNEETLKLKDALDKLVKIISRQWRDKRSQKKEEEVEEIISEDFYDGLQPHEIKNIEKIKKALVKNSVNSEKKEEIVSVLNTVKSMYQFNTFKDYVVELNDKDITLDNIRKIADDWEQIETKELAKIATGRIEAIVKFEKYIKENAYEVQTIQPFLERFSWILDPRITTFEREKKFSDILKETFPDDKLEEKNRRIDFLCNMVNGQLMIVELKRPNIKISYKEIQQALDYKGFIQDKYKDDNISEVITILISDNHNFDRATKDMVDSLKETNRLFVRTYSGLLNHAREYNKEFIKQYEKIKSAKEESTN